jgi:hypothetical protein
MQKSRVTTEDAGLHSKKSFIRRSTSGEDADSPGSSPSFTSLSPYLLLLSSRATEFCLATTLTWSDGMKWCVLQVRERGPISSTNHVSDLRDHPSPPLDATNLEPP